MSDILEEWIKVQMSWMYLYPIFDSQDITKQLPLESRRFRNVDKFWCSLML
jgi:dynein heavy chain